MPKAFFALLFLLLGACSQSEKKAAEKIPMLLDQEAKALGFNIFYVPVKLEDIEREFQMQFDLGLDVSVVYENALQSIQGKHPKLKEHIQQRKDYSILHHPYAIGKQASGLDSLFVYEGYGEKAPFETLKVIGSIGVNEFKNKILLINYAELYIQVLEELDTSQFEFSKLRLSSGNKIIIELEAGGQKQDFLFDTGNGVPILTLDKDFYQQLAQEQQAADTISANSWGTTIYLYGAVLQERLGSNGQSLTAQNNRIYFTEAERIKALYQDIGVVHSIGNDFFMNKTVVFDFINNRFGIQKDAKR